MDENKLSVPRVLYIDVELIYTFSYFLSGEIYCADSTNYNLDRSYICVTSV